MAWALVPLDLAQPFLPEALDGASALKKLGSQDRLLLNQIGAVSYVHLFDVFETCLADAVRAQAVRDVDARDTLVPLLRLDAFDHNEMFQQFVRVFRESFPVPPKLLDRPDDLDDVLSTAAPLSLLVVALHLKLVTQQHYLACVRGKRSLEPSFVKVLKDHFSTECRDQQSPSSARAIEQALGVALPGRVPAALRDYRRIVFACDDVLRRQSELDVATLEDARGSSLSIADRPGVLTAQLASLRRTFLTFGIVNTAFVYAMRNLGPTAPAMLANVVTALSVR